MALDEQRLVIALEARLTKYERDMARAGKVANDNYRRIESRTKQFGDNTEKALGKSFDGIARKIESGFAPFLRGGAVFAALAGTAIAVKEVADSVAEVDREARKAGVSAKVWQQWTYVATATGASVDGVTDALKELNIRGDEFARTDAGSGAEWFKRLGYDAEEVGRKLQDPNRFLDELIGKIQQLDSAGRTRALDELFGGTGAEQLAKTLGLSVTEIQRLRSEAATFTDEQIEAAKKIDREFDTLWRNFTVYAKQAAIEGVGIAKQINSAIQGEWVPGYISPEDARALYSSPAYKLKQAEGQRDDLNEKRTDLQKEINRLQTDTGFNATRDMEIKELKGSLSSVASQLAEVEAKIADLTGKAKESEGAVNGLSGAADQTGSSFSATSSAATTFRNALDELKKIAPELKAELDTLAQLDGFDAAFRKAASSAKLSIGEILSAADIANRARSVARFGSHDNMQDLIGAAEGTDRGRGYNETLDYGRWTGGAVNLTSMTLDEVLALQGRMLANPDNRALYGDGKGSSAVGRYQITRRTLQDMMKELGLTGDRQFDEGTQDELARALLRRRGNDPAELRNEWEGLRQVDDATIRNAYANTPTAPQDLPPTDAQQQQTDLANRQTEARRNLNQTIQEGVDKARLEQSIAGMSENQKRVEIQLFEYQREAKRAGIVLSDKEIEQMRQKLELTGQLETEGRQAQEEQTAMQQAGMFFGQQFTQGLSGLLTGTLSVTDAVRNLANSLVDAALQAMLLGQGPLAALFGTAEGGGIFGAIFGFSEGGYTGPGRKHQAAGIVHKGEIVWSQRDVARAGGVGAVEAMRHGALPGLAEGGYVGTAPATLRTPNLKPANSNVAPVQEINISAPVTVNGSAGTEAQNTDLAQKMAKQMEVTMRSVVSDEIRRAARPGNYLYQRSR